MKVKKLPNELYDLETAINGRLDFASNFKAFEHIDVRLVNGTETELANLFKDGTIPNRFIVVDLTTSAAASISRGATDWTSRSVYVTARGATVTATLVFYRQEVD